MKSVSKVCVVNSRKNTFTFERQPCAGGALQADACDGEIVVVVRSGVRSD